MLRSSWTLCSTWAGRLQPSLLARCKRSLCFRYSVRVLGLWQYGWYVVSRAWEISQAYKVIQGEVWRSCTIELDWYKNSDLGSEVGTVTVLNSTTCDLIESVALLTKSIGILTPLVLSIVVVVAPRLISYKNAYARSYRTQDNRCRHEIESYRTRLPDCIVQGFGDGEEGKRKEGSPTCLRSSEVQS